MLLNENLKLNLIKAKDTVKAKHNRSLELMSQIHAMGGMTLKLKAPSFKNN